MPKQSSPTLSASVIRQEIGDGLIRPHGLFSGSGEQSCEAVDADLHCLTVDE